LGHDRLAAAISLTNSRSRTRERRAGAEPACGRARIIWLVRRHRSRPSAGLRSGRASLFSLIPAGAYLSAAQLAIAALLASALGGPAASARWSAAAPGGGPREPDRRGSCRLYQARLARDRAASALRAAALARLLPAVALPLGSPEPIVTSTLAARSG